MAIQNLNISDYISKLNGDEIPANEWNTIFSSIQSKINEIATAVNFGGGSSGGGNSGGSTSGPATALYINGVLHTESQIILEPQQTYVLQGELYGLLIVNAAGNTGDAPNDWKNTNLIFDGVTIITPALYGVYYAIPEGAKGYKGITITLAGDSVNTVMCTTPAEPGEDQPGAIYSQNNLRIQGSGYLNCINKSGHGIRASEIKLYNPHIYVDAIHDGIHAKNIHIYDGVYYFTNINDCFGTSDKTTACIYVCGGKIIANNMKVSSGNIFDYKQGTAYYIEKAPEIITNIPVSQYATANTGTYGKNTGVDGNLQNIRNSSYYGAGHIYAYADKTAMENGNNPLEVLLVNNIYTINSNYVGRKAFKVVGLITYPIEVETTFTSSTDDNSINFYLMGACIISSANLPCIFYLAKKNRMKIESVKEYHNIILQTATESAGSYDYDAIKSENNITLELGGESTLYISSKLGDGIDGSDVTCTDCTGVAYIENCGQRGIKGTSIVIGPNCEISGGVPKFYVETSDELINNTNYALGTSSTPATYFDGCFIVKNNCQVDKPSSIGDATGDASKLVGFADIYARKGKAGDKGSFWTLNKYLSGSIIIGSIGAMIGADLDFSYNIYVTDIISEGIQGIERLTYEQYLVYPKYSAPIIDCDKFKLKTA